MGFWWFMFACDLLIPVLMIVTGNMMWKRPPKKINWLIGYRTSRSTKNMDTWKFAHDYCGRLWWKAGWILLIPTVAVHIPFYRSSADAIGTMSLVLTGVQLVILILSIVPTEIALKRTFTDEGVRR